MLNLVFTVLLGLISIGLAYLYLLAFASLLPRRRQAAALQITRFAAAIPAHDEEQVIAATISSIRSVNYPRRMLDIYVVADHCNDQTAQRASEAGANVYQREGEQRGGKGPALAWLFQRIFETNKEYDAIAIFDADTRLDPEFFNQMNARFVNGVRVVQGNHIIRNPKSGWFPSLTWAMFLIDNRFQNLGRANLGLSAKNMGDSICFQTDILQRYGWSAGLTEDYEFRQRLLLEGIGIQYEPGAIGYGEAAANWRDAQAQRTRWLAGARQASRNKSMAMLSAGIKKRNLPLIDGALQALLPSYSTLTLISAGLTFLAWLLSGWLWSWLPLSYLGVFILFFLYPFLGLLCERAPLRAYLVILSGPVYIFWRSWLSILTRFRRPDNWVRTPRQINIK